MRTRLLAENAEFLAEIAVFLTEITKYRGDRRRVDRVTKSYFFVKVDASASSAVLGDLCEKTTASVRNRTEILRDTLRGADRCNNG